MHYEHQGMRLWVEPNERLAGGVIEPGSDVNLTLGIEPADASNRVQVQYRVNGGPAAAIAAEPVRHVGKTQYFKVQLPCAALRDGDMVEYTALCQCAGRQVPSAREAEEFASSFRVINAPLAGSSAHASTYAKGMTRSSTASSQLDTRRQTVVGETNQLKPRHLSLFALQRNSGHPIARMPLYAEVAVTVSSPPPKSQCKLKEAIRIVLREFYASLRGYASGDVDTRTPAETLAEPLCDALSHLLAQETIDRMARDLTYASRIIGGIFQKARDLGKNISPNDPEALRNLLEEAISVYAEEQDLPLAVIGTQEQRIAWVHPLGVLATDHVGYLSNGYPFH